MTDSADQSPSGPMSAIAALSGRRLDELYRLFRLPGAPNPVAHVAGVPVYDLEGAMEWLHPPEPAPEPADSVVKLSPPSV